MCVWNLNQNSKCSSEKLSVFVVVSLTSPAFVVIICFFFHPSFRLFVSTKDWLCIIRREGVKQFNLSLFISFYLFYLQRASMSSLNFYWVVFQKIFLKCLKKFVQMQFLLKLYQGNFACFLWRLKLFFFKYLSLKARHKKFFSYYQLTNDQNEQFLVVFLKLFLHFKVTFLLL